MRAIAVITVAGLAVAAASTVFLATRSDAAAPSPSRPPPRPAGASPHGAAMDDAFASVVAMYHAPEGATPCESAHNAFAAEAEAARKLGRESYFAFVAERTAFLAGCQALAPDTQLCLTPRYRVRHRAACDAALPPVETLSTLFVERAPGDEATAHAR